MFSNALESFLQKLVQMMGACRPILPTRSSSACALFGRLHIKTVLSIGDLSRANWRTATTTHLRCHGQRRKQCVQKTACARSPPWPNVAGRLRRNQNRSLRGASRALHGKGAAGGRRLSCGRLPIRACSARKLRDFLYDTQQFLHLHWVLGVELRSDHLPDEGEVLWQHPTHNRLRRCDLSREPSSEQQLTLVQDNSAARRQLLNQLVLGSFGLLCLSVDDPHFLNPIFWLLVPRVTHHGHVHTVCFTQGVVGACCGLLVVLTAIHELLCVSARPRPTWSLGAALVQSRSHVHLPSFLWIHIVCSDCSALLDTAQIPAARDSQDFAKRVRPT